MELKQRLYNVDEFWDLLGQLDDEIYVYELIDGELVEMPRPGGRHGQVAVRMGRFLDIFAEEHGLGLVTVETGYYSADDRHTLLGPDVAFICHERAPTPFPEKFVPLMPDLAVEIASPNDTENAMRVKAELYLNLGTQLVWLVMPATSAVEICRLDQRGELSIELVESESKLTGGAVLPGFELELRRIFD